MFTDSSKTEPTNTNQFASLEDEQTNYPVKFVNQEGDEVCVRVIKAWSYWEACGLAFDLMLKDPEIDDFHVL